MKKINHNLIKPIQSVAITIGIVGIMLLAGVVDRPQQLEKEMISQAKIDSAICYVDKHSDLGDSWDIKYYINEASIIYDLDSAQVVAVRNEYYLD
jgi:hypothetical protein